MALNVFFEPESNIVNKAYLAFGGMAPTTILARKTCNTMIGRFYKIVQYIYLILNYIIEKILIYIFFRKWDEDLLETTYDSLLNELPLSDNVPGGMVKYRRSLSLRYDINILKIYI